MKYFIAMLLLASCLVGCKYTSNPVENNIEEPPSQKGALKSDEQEAGISFEGDIRPLLKAKCMPCHGESNSERYWESYETVKDNIDEILGSINHESGYTEMPMGRSKLSDSDIELIEEWAKSGMLELGPVGVAPAKKPIPSKTKAPVKKPNASSAADNNHDVVMTDTSAVLSTSMQITTVTDEANISFEANIKPLFKNNCMPCHDSSKVKNWQDYNTVTDKINISKILGAINHEAGYMQMPMSNDKLGPDDIRMVQAWVDTGMDEFKKTVVVPVEPLLQEVEAMECITEVPEVVEVIKFVEVQMRPVLDAETFFKDNCIQCHKKTAIYPNLYGQKKQYLIDQLMDFRDHSRVDGAMNYYAKTFLQNDDDIEDLADYLSEKKPCDAKKEKVKLLLERGDRPGDIVTGEKAAGMCISCHSKNNANFPIIYGLNPNYLLKTLTELQGKSRFVRPSNTMKMMIGQFDRQQLIDIVTFLNQKNECE